MNQTTVITLIDLSGVIAFFSTLLIGIALNAGFLITTAVGASLIATSFILSMVLRYKRNRSRLKVSQHDYYEREKTLKNNRV